MQSLVKKQSTNKDKKPTFHWRVNNQQLCATQNEIYYYKLVKKNTFLTKTLDSNFPVPKKISENYASV